MNGWVKLFVGGNREVGLDIAVSNKTASWRHGRLENMIGAELQHSTGRIGIYSDIPGEYWQSDDYALVMGDSAPQVISRRLQKRLHDNDLIFMTVVDTAASLSLYTYRVLPISAHHGAIRLFSPTDRGKWLTVQLSINRGEAICRWYINDRRK